MVNTRPHICYAMNTLSHLMCEPWETHLVVSMHIPRYLQGTIGYGLKYKNDDLDLHGYTNSDWVGSVIDRKNTFGCCFILGSTMISWISRKQSLVA